MAAIRNVLLGLLVSLPACGPTSAQREHQPATRPKGHFSLTKETTFVTEPLDKDGYVDYVAALNEPLRAGVTPANNAWVGLLKALGPCPDGLAIAPEAFRLAGVEPAPNKEGYFISLAAYTKDTLKLPPHERLQVEQQLERCTRQPWKPQECPHLDAWLKANEKPLVDVVEATRCRRFYVPLLPGTSEPGPAGVIHTVLPAVQECRLLAKALAARAVLRAGQGAAEDGWSDLLTCHRLGRLIAQGGTVLVGLAGLAIDGIALRADIAFLDCVRADPKLVKRCLGDLSQLPTMPNMADHLNWFERIMILDTLAMVDRHGTAYLESLPGPQSNRYDPAATILLENVDWDPALQAVNRIYDRMGAAMRDKDRNASQAQWNQILTEIRALKQTVESGPGAAASGGTDQAAKVRGRFVGDVVIFYLVPAFHRVRGAVDRNEQAFYNVRLAFTLARYFQDHGGYPQRLDMLVPAFLPEIRPDLFSGRPLIYRPNANGFLLYSVGEDGQDDQGRGYEDAPKGDDVSVALPVTSEARQ
jgi:hypothetical protein